jgi:DNA repair protein RecO (recombination protein O)
MVMPADLRTATQVWTAANLLRYDGGRDSGGAAVAIYNADGIIIRVRDFDEADKVAVILTREEGKVQAVAKGARRPRNRFAAAVQLFTHLQLQLYHGRNMDTLSQAEIVESFRSLREDLVRMAYATYACELMDAMLAERQKHDAPFLLLLTSLHLFNELEMAPEPILRAYELKLLSMMGFRPSLDACVNCGTREIASGGAARFSPVLGGVLCPRCSSEGEGAMRISLGTVQTMRHLMDGDIRRAHVIRLGGDMGEEIDRALSAYIIVRTEKKLKSKEFLDTLRS